MFQVKKPMYLMTKVNFSKWPPFCTGSEKFFNRKSARGSNCVGAATMFLRGLRANPTQITVYFIENCYKSVNQV